MVQSKPSRLVKLQIQHGAKMVDISFDQCIGASSGAAVSGIGRPYEQLAPTGAPTRLEPQSSSSRWQRWLVLLFRLRGRHGRLRLRYRRQEFSRPSPLPALSTLSLSPSYPPYPPH